MFRVKILDPNNESLRWPQNSSQLGSRQMVFENSDKLHQNKNNELKSVIVEAYLKK